MKAYSELQTFLPEVLGGISKTGKITDFGVETLTEDRSLTKAQRAATARKKKRAGARGRTVVANTPAAKVRNA